MQPKWSDVQGFCSSRYSYISPQSGATGGGVFFFLVFGFFAVRHEILVRPEPPCIFRSIWGDRNASTCSYRFVSTCSYCFVSTCSRRFVRQLFILVSGHRRSIAW